MGVRVFPDPILATVCEAVGGADVALGEALLESMRGAGEGHYAWDLPDSTMTNGAATGVVAKGRAGTMTVRHGGETVEIDVTRRTQIVALTMGDRALLVPGAAVMALAAPSERFHWLTAPRSDVLQSSPVHECVGDPATELDRLFEFYIKPA